MKIKLNIDSTKTEKKTWEKRDYYITPAISDDMEMFQVSSDNPPSSGVYTCEVTFYEIAKGFKTGKARLGDKVVK